MSQPITLEQIANEDFFVLVGLDDLDEKEKDELLEKIHETVQARVYLSIQKQLSEDERDKMDALDADHLVPFLESHGIDILKLTYEESLRYRFELAVVFGKVTESLS